MPLPIGVFNPMASGARLRAFHIHANADTTVSYELTPLYEIHFVTFLPHSFNPFARVREYHSTAPTIWGLTHPTPEALRAQDEVI